MTTMPAGEDARVLYTYFRSSAAYRVRIALALKGLAYHAVPVHLLRHGGEQRAPAYRAISPAALVPSYRDDSVLLQQSLAIIEYLEERYPQPALLPSRPEARAKVRQFALSIACDIHPLNNLRVLQYLQHSLHQDEAARQAWVQHWVQDGLEALEQSFMQSGGSGRYCWGDTPTLADCCLVPQLFNARRFHVDLSRCPRLLAIDAACAELPAFQQAHPACQTDAE